jgi:SAM-dependent methyltransferase
MKCRHCKSDLNHTLVDLGSSPPSNSYLTKHKLYDVEKWYPLKVLVCESCWLVQTADFVAAEEMFTDDYTYFSSSSNTWLKHAEDYVIKMVNRFGLSDMSTVVEIAANDGYLLQYLKSRKIPCYGIEPTHSTSMVARKKGIEIEEFFFGVDSSLNLTKQNRQADLIVANNVLAHVPNINDFVTAFSILLKPDGVATFEFPHLLNLIQEMQFDTIYHEHFSYLSLTSIKTIFKKCGLAIFDVEEITTHGGSLRVYAQRSDTGIHSLDKSVAELKNKEDLAGINTLSFYRGFQEQIESIKNDFLEFLVKAKKDGKKVAAYGAAAKGNTILNFSGVRPDLLPYVVDINPAKIGRFLPGSRVPIVDDNKLKQEKPDYIVVLPWNWESEIRENLSYAREWGCEFVMLIPQLTIT